VAPLCHSLRTLLLAQFSLYRLLACIPADLFVRKVPGALYQRCLSRSCDSAVANPYVRNFVDTAPRATRYIYVHIIHICSICTLRRDLSLRWLSVRQDVSLFFPITAVQIPARIVFVLYFISILKFKELRRVLSEIRSVWIQLPLWNFNICARQAALSHSGRLV